MFFENSSHGQIALDSRRVAGLICQQFFSTLSFLKANDSGDLRLTCSTKKTAKQLQRDFIESSRAFLARGLFSFWSCRENFDDRLFDINAICSRRRAT